MSCVARAAKVVAVKVLDDNNRGYVSNMISGMNWVYNQVQVSKRPSVVSMSILTDDPSTSVDGAVTNVAAGNKNVDASNTSPARAAGAIVVGATNITDSRASFYNYGPPVSIFAPGQNIISAGIAGRYALSIFSGTSMATPHVSGLVAYLISRDGNIKPAEMRNKLRDLALNGVLSNIPSGTVNKLAQNGLPALSS